MFNSGFYLAHVRSKTRFPSAFGQKITRKTDESQALNRRVEVGLSNQIVQMIDLEILRNYGGEEITLKKDDVIFRQNQVARDYFQVVKGSIKIITDSPEGKEFIQSMVRANDSFGEPPLLCSFPYPSTAIAIAPTVIIKLSRDRFLRLLRENFEIHLQLDRVLCERLKYKSMVLSEISSHDPAHRIMSLLKYLKNESGRPTGTGNRNGNGNRDYIVPLTRQQIADMSGMRVETVIRTVKRMEEEGKLKVVSRKIAL